MAVLSEVWGWINYMGYIKYMWLVTRRAAEGRRANSGFFWDSVFVCV